MSFLQDFISWSRSNLESDAEAFDYITNRGINESVISRMSLGSVTSDFFVDVSSDPHHDPKRCKDRLLRCDSCRFEAWSHIYTPGESFSPKLIGSVVMPLTTYSGSIYGIQVRHTKEKVFDTFVLKRRPESYFFGIGPNIESIFNQKAVFVTEAPFDCMTLQSCGFSNCISICTNSVSSEQAKTIIRFSQKVYTCFDSDLAGRSGAKDFFNRYSDRLDISNVIIPDTYKIRVDGTSRQIKDFNDLQKHFGNEIVKKVIGDQI